MKIGCLEVPEPSYLPLLWPAEWKTPPPLLRQICRNCELSRQKWCFPFLWQNVMKCHDILWYVISYSSHSVLLIASQFYQYPSCSIDSHFDWAVANIFELPSKDITPEKRINCAKCSLATKHRMFGAFAINEILCYRISPLPLSTLCATLVLSTFLTKVLLQSLEENWAAFSSSMSVM